LLVKGTQQMALQREFLGLQAHALAEAGVLEWMRITPRPSPVATGLAYTITRAGTPSVAPTTAIVAVVGGGGPPIFTIRATASVTGSDGQRVDREVQATASCPANVNLACTGRPSFQRVYTP
jgi:hypothetical protein